MFVLALVASVATTGAGCRRGPTAEPQSLAARREAHRQAARAAADVCNGLWQRVDADEPLTPEFLELLCAWPRRVYFHERATATSDSQRAAAADHFRRGQRKTCDLLHDRSYEFPDRVLPQLLITEFHLGESELLTAAPPAPGLPHRSLAETADLLLARYQKRIDDDEPLTPEFVDLLCKAWRRVCMVGMACGRAQADRLRAAEDYRTRVSGILECARHIYSFDGTPYPVAELEYCLAEANHWISGIKSGSRTNVYRPDPAMAAAARAHVDCLRRRKEAETPLEIAFVEELCVWSRRHAAAASAREEHLRRMKDLYAECVKRFHQGRDVSQIQVSQAEYFVHDAEDRLFVDED